MEHRSIIFQNRSCVARQRYAHTSPGHGGLFSPLPNPHRATASHAARPLSCCLSSLDLLTAAVVLEKPLSLRPEQKKCLNRYFAAAKLLTANLLLTCHHGAPTSSVTSW